MFWLSLHPGRRHQNQLGAREMRKLKRRGSGSCICHSTHHRHAWRTLPPQSTLDARAGFRSLARWAPPDGLYRPPHGKLDLLTYHFLHPRNLLFGTPDYVAGKIEELRDELNLQYLQVWSNFPGVPHEHVMKSVRMFTELVMPRFASDDSKIVG